MRTLVIDASVAVKWVVEEDGTPHALMLRQKALLIAPEILMAECADILWKKVKRNELMGEEALLAARLLQVAEIELFPIRSLTAAATRMAIELDHPAYDCVYLALAIDNGCQFVTADERLLRRSDQGRHQTLRAQTMSLTQAAAL